MEAADELGYAPHPTHDLPDSHSPPSVPFYPYLFDAALLSSGCTNITLGRRWDSNPLANGVECPSCVVLDVTHGRAETMKELHIPVMRGWPSSASFRWITARLACGKGGGGQHPGLALGLARCDKSPAADALDARYLFGRLTRNCGLIPTASAAPCISSSSYTRSPPPFSLLPTSCFPDAALAGTGPRRLPGVERSPGARAAFLLAGRRAALHAGWGLAPVERHFNLDFKPRVARLAYTETHRIVNQAARPDTSRAHADDDDTIARDGGLTYFTSPSSDTTATNPLPLPSLTLPPVAPFLLLTLPFSDVVLAGSDAHGGCHAPAALALQAVE
ncbi:hypothetical protein B0H19DRAFT_1368050 [Mycena capillaripes]|nr:hypothetical protein B0H19DRAFT_1368050 [Mycena capillaripes]